MMEVVVTIGITRRANAPIKSSPPNNTQLPAFYRPDALPVAQPTVSAHITESFLNNSTAINP